MKFKLIDKFCWPIKKHDNDAGIDLRSKHPTFMLKPGERQFVELGVQVEIPRGHVGLLYLRSSVGTKTYLKLANGTGIIDSDYRGEIIACIENCGTKEEEIKQYEPIAQLVVVPCLLSNVEVVERLSETKRGNGGFGSTNTKESIDEKKPVKVGVKK